MNTINLSGGLTEGQCEAGLFGFKDRGFEVFSNPPSVWPAFLVGQRERPVRVAIVDADAHFLNVLHQELSQDERLLIVGKAFSLKVGKRLCRSVEFDVLLLDLNLPDGSGFNLLGMLATHRPACHCIVVTVIDQDETLIRAIELGASGYLVKHSWFGGYAQSVLQVANGGAAITPQITKRLLKNFEARISDLRNQVGIKPKPVDQLSAREKDILRMVAGGHTSMEIGRRLEISGMTVNTHVKNIYRKLQVRSRAQAVRLASLHGLL